MVIMVFQQQPGFTIQQSREQTVIYSPRLYNLNHQVVKHDQTIKITNEQGVFVLQF
jgi:hypothetical protein